MSVKRPRLYLSSKLNKMGSDAPIILRIAIGNTSWWQIVGRHNTTFKKRLQMDEHYISNWSLSMDAYILLKTFWVVLSGSGA